MAMFEISLMCPEDRVEHLSDALAALDALSVSVEDADAQTDAEQALLRISVSLDDRVGHDQEFMAMRASSVV